MSGTDWTTTPNLGLFKPIYDADVEQWGEHLNANADTLDATLAQTGASAVFVALAGASMTGPLVLSQDPTAALGAATKQYVDGGRFTDAPSDANAYGRKGGAWATVVPVAGATMTGPLVLSGDPSAAQQASTKNYVDTQLTLVTGVTVADAAPTTPKQGSLWFDSVSGRLYLSFNDGNSTQWVAV